MQGPLRMASFFFGAQSCDIVKPQKYHLCDGLENCYNILAPSVADISAFLFLT